MDKVKIIIYRWAGKFGPFKIKTTCGECGLCLGIVKDVAKEFGPHVEIVQEDWLTKWYKPILIGGWHAPIIVINGKVLSQGVVVDRDKLRSVLIKEIYKNFKIDEGNYIFTLPDCGFCKKSKKILNDINIKFEECDVLKDNVNMQKMLSLILGKVHPITLPQIFIGGKWIRGYKELSKMSRKELMKLDKNK